jgi:hypothetical protein
MTIKYLKMFDSKAFQNVPKLGIWFENKPSGNPGLELGKSLYTKAVNGITCFMHE